MPNPMNKLILGGFILLIVASGLATQGQESKSHDGAKANAQMRRGAFTGPDVSALAPILGDYENLGARTPEGRTDLPKLMAVLQEIHARDYMHLVWTEKKFPSGWQDFQLMAPEFQKANIRLWLYLTPPSEEVPDPYGEDYVRWAVECAKVAKQYPMVKGICIDDFNGNVKKFTPAYCRQMMDEAHKTAPDLSLLVVCYFGYEKNIKAHVAAGAIDGVIFPYFYPQKNLSDTTKLRPQIESYRAWLDERTQAGGLARKMPMVVMVYGRKHSESRDSPTPGYVRECLEIGLKSTEEGLTDGVVMFCLPKDNPLFINPVAEVFKEWEMKSSKGNRKIE